MPLRDGKASFGNYIKINRESFKTMHPFPVDARPNKWDGTRQGTIRRGML
jgi:hypothetical protein